MASSAMYQLASAISRRINMASLKRNVADESGVSIVMAA